ncbi:MAG TPA: phage major tail tube protein [Candidatus Binataceae bacterium]|nr:phage major tail tube protein [Candidatus Binataceae bacterium]
MDLSVNRITNANIYVDGVGLLGRAEEIEVAQPRHLMIDHKGLGMAGVAEFWAGVAKLESRIKWTSIYPEVELLASSPFSSHSFQVMGSIEQYTSQGLAAELPLVYLMTGVFKDAGAFTFKPHENVDSQSVVSVYHTELYVSGVQIFLYDVMSNQYVVGGVDQLAQFRANLGE